MLTTYAMTEALAGQSASFREGQLKDLPGHALLHGTFRLPAIVPDRDFIWDQVALRLPTGSVLIAGKSVDDEEVSDVPSPKGHVRGVGAHQRVLHNPAVVAGW